MKDYITWSIRRSAKPHLERMARDLGNQFGRTITLVELADIIAADQAQIVSLLVRIKKGLICPECGSADVTRKLYSEDYVCEACGKEWLCDEFLEIANAGRVPAQ
ncbi:MAG: hypothetical protein ACXABY_35015 [Candidatus Thorarchaeota archaeon]|jgi:DNA-directed RNA polymerase subunit RPC12/RpoP